MLRPPTRWAEDRQEAEGPGCPPTTAAFTPLSPSTHQRPLQPIVRLPAPPPLTHPREVIASEPCRDPPFPGENGAPITRLSSKLRWLSCVENCPQ